MIKALRIFLAKSCILKKIIQHCNKFAIPVTVIQTSLFWEKSNPKMPSAATKFPWLILNNFHNFLSTISWHCRIYFSYFFHNIREIYFPKFSILRNFSFEYFHENFFCVEKWNSVSYKIQKITHLSDRR